MENSEKIETWTDASGRVHKISEMTFAHLSNTTNWIKNLKQREFGVSLGWEDFEDTNFDAGWDPTVCIIAKRRIAYRTLPFLEAELERRTHLFHGAF